jgi:hypothetical protein
MGRGRFARQQRGGSSWEKGNEVCRLCAYNSQRVCMCLGVIRKNRLRKMVKRSILECQLLK